MKILQYNCQSLKNNTDRISFYLNKIGYVIVVLSEVFSNKNRTNKIINFNLIEKTRADGYGGVAIGLRKNIKFNRIRYQCDDIVIIRTNNLKRNFYICTVYFPPSMKINCFSSISNLVYFLEPFNDVLILGEFNVRNINWGDVLNTPRGTLLENLLHQTDFSILNNGDFINDSSGSVLDLSISNTRE